MCKSKDFDVMVACTENMFNCLEIEANKEQIIKMAGWVNMMMEMTSQIIQQRIIQYIKTGSDELDNPVEN